MVEYVTKQTVIDELSRYGLTEDGEAIINAIPAADVVRVVRCRECIYWRGENDICKGIGIDFDADGYCSEGKRKDGGKDNG